MPDPESEVSTASVRPVTGRTVFLWLVAFFAVIFAANIWLVSAAIRSFGGLDRNNAYKEGLAYEKEIVAAEAQKALGWTVLADFSGDEARRVLTIKVQDKSGLPVSGLEARARLLHPTRSALDLDVALRGVGSGVYRGESSVQAGARELVIELFRRDERVFRSQSRVSLH